MASYYISPSGSNSSGTGSQSNPWATLDHAISRVTTPGDDIRVMAGNYPAISSQMELAQKVSIIGAGRDVTTITLTSTSGGGCIKMESYGQWTNKTIGFQSISGIKFVGSTTSGSPIGHIAISMYFRNHVYIHDCEFVDFVRSAVRFNGQQYWSGFNIDNPYYNGSKSDMLYIPFNNSFAEGNRFYNNIVHNCCGRIGTTNDFSGALEVSVNDGCLVYDNYMTATGRPGNDNGVPIKFIGAGAGFNRNSKIYNNHIIAGHMNTNYWQFAIEIWWDLGGTEVYNNTCEGALDLCDSWDQYGAGYGIRCYNNNIGYSQNTTNLDRGILFEGTHIDTYVYNNHIHHVARAITHNNNNSSNATIYNNVHIYNNYAHHLSGRDYQTWGIYWDPAINPQGGLFQDIFIRHNTFHASEDAPGTTMHGVMIPTVTELDSWYLENNIIMNFEYSPIYGSGVRDQATNLFMRNNLIYGCGNNNNPVYQSNFPTAGVTFSGTVKSNPLFVSISSQDFHVQPASPAINAGRSTDVTVDYDGNVRSSSTPTIGAFEYISASTTYYVRTDGVDTSSRDGLSPSTAWATLSYAASRVSIVGSTIYIAEGVYAESSRCNLAVGVSIKGSGQDTCFINFTYAASGFSNGCIYAVSSSVVDGNQSISDFSMYGTNYSSERAIYTRYRNNFIIHDVIIRRFKNSGINAYSEIDWVTPPPVFTTGLKIYNCYILDCSIAPCTGNECNLRWSGHENFEIYSNVFSNTTRWSQDNIYSSQVKNGKIYNNSFYTRNTSYSGFVFAMELWNNRGGIEIYGNYLEGCGTIDIAGHTTEKGIYEYAVLLHDNILSIPSPVDYNSYPTAAITIECWISIESVYCYNNYIHNFPWGINITAGQENAIIEDLHIHANVIDGVTNSDVSWNSFGIGLIRQAAGITRRRVDIYNNTIIGETSNSYRGIVIAVDGTNEDIEVKNNIIKGFNMGVRLENYSGTINLLHLMNNIINNCVYTVNIQSGTTYTNYINSGQITSDPLFVSTLDYHLQANSPAIGAGVYLGLLKDKDGNPWNNPPSIGAYEYLEESPSGDDVAIRNAKFAHFSII